MAADAEIVARLTAATKEYRVGDERVRALRGVSLALRRGELVAITGASGSGKSTLLNILGCLDVLTDGDYELEGASVSHLDPDELAELRNARLGFVFQGYNLLARTTARDNVELPLVYAGLAAPERRERAMAALEQVGLADRARYRASQLSGGQQQRVAIARALVNDPSLLLADEPTGNLDTATRAEIVRHLLALHRRGITIVLVTHEPEVAACAERRIVLRDGAVVGDTRAET